MDYMDKYFAAKQRLDVKDESIDNLMNKLDERDERIQELKSAIPKAFMAGQSSCGVDPSWSEASSYAKSVLTEDKE